MRVRVHRPQRQAHAHVGQRAIRVEVEALALAHRHQRLPFVRRVTGPKADFPGASYEAQVVGRGNALLDAYARNQSGGGPVLYVNRSAPIAGAAAVAGAPAMIESPCFHSHPYGALTDVSVCLVLRAVEGLAHGPVTR